MTRHERAGVSRPTIVYISYDGMLEPLGQSQVLAYLERLACNYDVHLLSFEKTADWQGATARENVAARMRAANIHWHPLRYHKRLSVVATALDIFMGTMVGLWLVWRYRVRIVHARSYVPAVIALTIKRLTDAHFLFDMRGFWADERADSGAWPRDGRLYKLAKRLERRFLMRADHVVSLTGAAVREMRRFDYLHDRMPPMTVIPTCADLTKFQPQSKVPRAGLIVGYVGTAGTWYRFDVTAACYRVLLDMRPDTRFLIVNRDEHAYIRDQLAAAGVPESAVELKAAVPGDVPAAMARMDTTIFFINPCFSKLASAPTKLGEFLGCGVPCLSNTGVGDMTEILEGDRVGAAIEAFDPARLRAGIERLLALLAEPGVRERCVAVAGTHFSLEMGMKRYTAIYQSLLDQS